MRWANVKSDKERAVWDALWAKYEQELAREFLHTTDPEGVWLKLQAARDFKLFAEGLEDEQA